MIVDNDYNQDYLFREELAKISESKTDNILDNVEEEVQEIDPKVCDIVLDIRLIYNLDEVNRCSILIYNLDEVNRSS